MTRRNFLSVGGGLAASWTLPARHQFPAPSILAPASSTPTTSTPATNTPSTNTSSIKAILFDAFPIFDPTPVSTLATQLFPEQANNLVTLWRIKQFEYTWLRSLTGAYTDFLTITSDALEYAAAVQKLNIDAQQHRQLVGAYNHLQTWPEVPAALAQLKASGYRLGILSNFTPDMLRINTQNCKLTTHFDHLLSVEQIRTYKPDPRTYRLAMDNFQLSKEEILFVPFTGWDAAGAKSFGFPTFWINRLQAPPDRLGVTPDREGLNLHDLIDWLAVRSPHR